MVLDYLCYRYSWLRDQYDIEHPMLTNWKDLVWLHLWLVISVYPKIHRGNSALALLSSLFDDRYSEPRNRSSCGHGHGRRHPT